MKKVVCVYMGDGSWQECSHASTPCAASYVSCLFATGICRAVLRGPWYVPKHPGVHPLCKDVPISDQVPISVTHCPQGISFGLSTCHQQRWLYASVVLPCRNVAICGKYFFLVIKHSSNTMICQADKVAKYGWAGISRTWAVAYSRKHVLSKK